jgi:hypothetical protein
MDKLIQAEQAPPSAREVAAAIAAE